MKCHTRWRKGKSLSRSYCTLARFPFAFVACSILTSLPITRRDLLSCSERCASTSLHHHERPLSPKILLSRTEQCPRKKRREKFPPVNNCRDGHTLLNPHPSRWRIHRSCSLW